LYIPCDRDTSTTTTTKRRPVGRWSARHHLPRYHCGTRTTTAGRNAHPSARRSQGDGVLRSELLALAGSIRGHFADAYAALTQSASSRSPPLIRSAPSAIWFLFTHFLLLCCNPHLHNCPKHNAPFPRSCRGRALTVSPSCRARSLTSSWVKHNRALRILLIPHLQTPQPIQQKSRELFVKKTLVTKQGASPALHPAKKSTAAAALRPDPGNCGAASCGCDGR